MGGLHGGGSECRPGVEGAGTEAQGILARRVFYVLSFKHFTSLSDLICCMWLSHEVKMLVSILEMRKSRVREIK